MLQFQLILNGQRSFWILCIAIEKCLKVAIQREHDWLRHLKEIWQKWKLKGLKPKKLLKTVLDGERTGGNLSKYRDDTFVHI